MRSASSLSVSADQAIIWTEAAARAACICFGRRSGIDCANAFAAETMAGRERRLVSSSTLAAVGRRLRNMRMFRTSDPRHW